MLSHQLKSLTDLRKNPNSVGLLARQLKEPVYILNRNKVEFILTDAKAYEEREELIDTLLDQIDMVEIREMKRTTKLSDFVPLEKVEKRLGLRN